MREGLGPRSRRLFLAVWPSDELRERIARDTAALVERSRGRATPARNFHITLVFLGEVANARVDLVHAAAASIAGSCFEVVFDQVETWPGSDVMCLTARHAPRALQALSDALRARLIADGFEFGRHGFRPHVTLARDVPQMRSTEALAPIAWRVDDYVLVESNMTRTGSEYTVLERWPLSRSTPKESR